MCSRYSEQSSDRPNAYDQVCYSFVDEGDVNDINLFYNNPSIRPSASNMMPRTAEQWAWEYGRRSACASCYVVARCEGSVIGIQAYIPIAFYVNGVRLLTGKDEDTLVSPMWRGKGILDGMYKHLFANADVDGVAFLWGFTSTAIRPLKRNGYKSLGNLCVFERMLSVNSYVSQYGVWSLLRGSLKISRYRRLIGLVLKHFKRTNAQCHSELVIKRIDCHCDQVSSFSNRFNEYWGGINVIYDRDYFSWRIAGNPYYHYYVWVAERHGIVVGLLIVKINGRVGVISDLAALGDNTSNHDIIISALLENAVEFCRDQRCYKIQAIAQGGCPFNVHLRDALRKQGFDERVTNSEIMVRAIKCNESDVCDISKWRISEILSEY